ncbi:hypothetical protein FRC09_019802 [Ceratobasidium sp. 395]|nr:hypothetical protein FRC09_019802 [Ceratobasidium sp. 395]
MPVTLRALERRIGMDFSDSITVFPTCPVETCGKRYTFEELAALRDPQCTRHVEEPRCHGILYTETVLADGTRKRTPTKSFPYNSLIRALGRLLSRIGMPDFMQHWRGPGDEPLEPEDVPPPLQAQDWLNQVQFEDRFSDISQGWHWRSEATGLHRHYDGQEYVDEPTGDEPLSLSRLPLGLSLGMNMDGYAFRGKFTAGGNYSVNGVYIVVNNLPFYLRTLIENMILAIVIPGPKEPKGYALDQMLEPLVDDLIRLANGVELPVYNHATGRIEQRLVYANLSTLFLDWIARIKCTGHVGTKAEHNHCLYCKIRQCLLSTEDGYRSDRFEPRDPVEHLQLKHEWHRAPVHEREEIRQRNGTTFVELDRLPSFYSFDNSAIDVMHLFDEGLSPAIVRDIIFKPGMLRKRFRQQPEEETPEACFDAFVARTYFPSHCSRLPAKISKMGSRMKAELWRNLLVILPVALFEAWRVGDAIPNGDIPRGGQNTKHRKQQARNAKLLLQRRRHVHDLNGGDLDNAPAIEDCASSRNPRDYFANVMRYSVAYKGIFRHRITRRSVSEISALLELVGATFARMNIHLPPSFHLATHLGDHLLKYGNPFNTWLYYFERANRILINVNTNGHGMGVLEATMAKGFLRRAECYRYVKMLQDINEPTEDDLATLKVLLDAMRHGPEHEAQHGMLNAVLAGEAHFHGLGRSLQTTIIKTRLIVSLEHIRLATASAQVDFQSRQHAPYYRLLIQFINENNPFDGVQFYGPGVRPPGGVYLAPKGSTVSYPNFYRYGVRYGADSHHRGRNSRYGYIYNQRQEKPDF